MAVEVEEKKEKDSGVRAGKDQEIGSTQGMMSFEEFALKTVEGGLKQVVFSLLWNVVNLKHIASAKTLIDLGTLARQVHAGKEIPAEAWQGFAENFRGKFLEPADEGSVEGRNEEQSQG